MTFGADGQVQGSGGCNSYGGPYKLDGPAIDVGDLASTMMLCQDQSIGAQETAFFAALGGAQTWQIEGTGDLVLAGVSQIVAKSAPAEPSGSAATGVVGAWNLAEMGPTADFAHLQPTIEFTADGSVSGFAGLQHVQRQSYTTDGAALTFGPLATTRMACQRPGSAVEADYLSALSGVTGWAIEPDGRLLLDGAVPSVTPRDDVLALRIARYHRDAMEFYPWIVIGHVFLVILAFGAHGVSAFTVFRVRSAKDRTELRTLLDLSATALTVAGVMLLVAIVLGIWAAIIGGHFARLWPWAAIAVVIVVTAAMTPLAANPMRATRVALGIGTDRSGSTLVAGSDADIAAATSKLRPEATMIIGVVGLALLVWLMEGKPF